jgi:excisionase family DNA binding protein
MSEEQMLGLDDIRHCINTTEARTVSVEEAGRRLGVSRMAAYQAVWRGQIPSIRIGRKVLVPIAKLNEMLGEKEEVLR